MTVATIHPASEHVSDQEFARLVFDHLSRGHTIRFHPAPLGSNVTVGFFNVAANGKEDVLGVGVVIKSRHNCSFHRSLREPEVDDDGLTASELTGGEH